MEKDIQTEKKKKKKREKMKQKNNLDAKFIRFNYDSEKFNVDIEIGKIYNHIKESNKKLTEELTKKSLIENFSMRLLELEFEQNYSIKSNYLKSVVKEILPQYRACKLIA